MHSRSHKALSRVLLTRTQVVIQVVQWRFKVPDSHVDASEISPRSRALSAPCTFYSFLQLYLEYLYLCIRICIWVFVFVFVNSYLYLMHSDTLIPSPLQHFLWNFSCPRAVDTSGCGVGSRCVAAPPWEFPTIEREIAPPRTICPTTCGRFAHCGLSCGRSYLPTVIFPVADHICPLWSFL